MTLTRDNQNNYGDRQRYRQEGRDSFISGDTDDSRRLQKCEFLPSTPATQ
jgi:hypothetical protein